MQELPRQHRKGCDMAAHFWAALVMYFLNGLVIELKKKIQKNRPEFNCFPDNSYNIQLWSHVLSVLLCSFLAQL